MAKITSKTGKYRGAAEHETAWHALRKGERLFRETFEQNWEEEAQLSQAGLIRINKMTALGMMASAIAHEINNPNHFISVNAHMISEAWKDAAVVLTDHYREQGDFPLGGVPFSEMRYIIPQLLTAMSEGSARIKHIVDNLKNYSQQDRASLDTAVDVNRVITGSARLLTGEIRKYTDRFELQEGVDLPLTRGNTQQLEQVVINLVMNALQSLPDRSAGVFISGCLERKTDNILIRVRDEGVGLPQKILKQVSEPLYTIELDSGNRGLGLPIAFSIIRDHQGSLTFLSEPGEGTTATVSLPAYHSIKKRN